MGIGDVVCWAELEVTPDRIVCHLAGGRLHALDGSEAVVRVPTRTAGGYLARVPAADLRPTPEAAWADLDGRARRLAREIRDRVRRARPPARTS